MAEDRNNSNSSSQQQFKREPALRIFAQELAAIVLTTGKEDSEKADRFTPTYAFSPTGAKINKIFVCGVLTEVDEMETSGGSFIKAILVDATGAVGIMAGQFHPAVVASLRDIEAKIPAFVAVIGKPNVYKPRKGGCYVSIRPEDIRLVTEDIVETWKAETTKLTLERIRLLKDAITSGQGSDEMKKVISVYEPDIDDLKNMVMTAIGRVATTDNTIDVLIFELLHRLAHPMLMMRVAIINGLKGFFLCVKNNKNLPWEIASIQEPLGNATYCVSEAKVVGKSVAILGDGPIGVFATAVSRIYGATQVIASGVQDYRLGMMKNHGADHIINVTKQKTKDAIMDLTHGEGVDVVMEMSGSEEAFHDGLASVKRGGTFIAFGIPAKPVTLDLAEEVILKGIKIIAINGRRMFETWYEVSNLLNSGRLNLEDVLTHEFPLDKIDEAMSLLSTKEIQAGKIILKP